MKGFILILMFVVMLLWGCPMVFGQAQHIQKLTIDDFTGGVNNKSTATLSDPSECQFLQNFDFTTYGALCPRKGFSALSLAEDSLGTVEAIIPYNKNANKHLIIKRNHGSSFNDINTCIYTSIQAGTEDEWEWEDLYRQAINKRHPQTGVSWFMWNDDLYIASHKSEFMRYDGERFVPCRPLGPGQFKAVAIDSSDASVSSGSITGTVRYKVMYHSRIAHTTGYISDLSTPTFPVTVVDGYVLLTDISTESMPLALYREIDGSNKWTYVDSLGDTINGSPYTMRSWYLDTLANDSIGADKISGAFPQDTATYPHGFCASGYSHCCERSGTASCSRFAPGQMSASVDGDDQYADSGYGIMNGSLITGCAGDDFGMSVAYSTIWVDSIGRHSYMAPPRYVVCYLNSIDIHSPGIPGDSAKIDLSSIPVPDDTELYKNKLIIRSFNICCSGDDICEDEEGDHDTSGYRQARNWYIVDTIAISATTYTDSMPACSIHTPSRMYNATDFEPVLADFLQVDYDFQVDSTIIIQPTAAVIRGPQVALIGDVDNPNRVYLSDFGRPTTYISDKFIDLQSESGDWLVGLYSLGDILLAFRQNSIVSLSGFSFYQYQMSEFTRGVGLLAPQSLAGTKSTVYFAHNTGVYRITQSEMRKISEPIDSVYQSLSNKRYMKAAMVDDDYWLSTNSGTWVWSTTYNNWRWYDLTFDQVIEYDTDTSSLDWTTGTYIMLREDSLFTAVDGDKDSDDEIVCTYKSKSFFVGSDRTMIHHVDLEGSGSLDSIRVVLYEHGTGLDSALITSPSFSGGTLVRAGIHEIFTDCSLELRCYSTYTGSDITDWQLDRIIIGWQPWDEGKDQ